MTDVACSPNGHSQIKRLMKEARIAQGLRPRNVAERKRTILTGYGEDGVPRYKTQVLHPTKGWRNY